MVKRKCPVCGKYKFTDKEATSCKCSCGAELGPELNTEIGEADRKKAVFPVIGEELGNGYTVLSVWKKEYVLAVNQKAPEPYVVWHLDQDGETYGGSYFIKADSAERHYASLCFRWFDNSDELGLAVSVFNQLKWNRNIFVMEYDRNTGEILLNENALMRLIMMANPAQEPRRIRLMSQEQLKDWRQSYRLNKTDAKVMTPASEPAESPSSSGVVVDMAHMNANAIKRRSPACSTDTKQIDPLTEAIRKHGVPEKVYFDKPSEIKTITIKRKGIKIHNSYYWNESLAFYIGQTIKAIFSGERVQIFKDDTYLCEFLL